MNIKQLSIGFVFGVVTFILLLLMFDFLGANSKFFVMLNNNFSGSSLYLLLSLHDFIFIMLLFFICNYLIYRWLNISLTTAISAQLVIAILAIGVNLAGASRYMNNTAYFSYTVFITFLIAIGSLVSFLVIRKLFVRKIVAD